MINLRKDVKEGISMGKGSQEDTNVDILYRDANCMTWIKRVSPSKHFTTYNKQLYFGQETGLWIKISKYPAGTMTPLHWHNCGHSMYVISGKLKTHRGIYGPGTFVWFPEGNVSEHGATEDDDLVVMYIADKPFDITYVDDPQSRQDDMIVADPDRLPWIKRVSPSKGFTTYNKELYMDKETNLWIKLSKYPAGTVTPLHEHNCGHSMYVISGKLKTHEGVYGPGAFVWFPEGNVSEHGATEDDDLIVMYIADKPFDITYL